MLRNSSGLSYAAGMMMRYGRLSRHRVAFRAMTGVDVGEFDALYADFAPRFAAAERRRLSRAALRRPASREGPGYR